MANPRQYKIPDWFLNRQKDIVDGKYSQVRNLFISKEKEIGFWNTGFIVEKCKIIHLEKHFSHVME